MGDWGVGGRSNLGGRRDVGDMGTGDMLSGASEMSMALPLPLSSAVRCTSSGSDFDDPTEGEDVALAVLRCTSLRRWAMRSEIDRVRGGVGRASDGARRGEVVYLSPASSVFGANFALDTP